MFKSASLPVFMARRLIATTLSLAAIITTTICQEARAAVGPRGQSPAEQHRWDLRIKDINAVQLAWWFQHIADDGGRYWQSLAPLVNDTIEWRINPREDARHQVGALFVSRQRIPEVGFADESYHAQVQFLDYVTQRGGWQPGEPMQMISTMGLPAGYTPPYPSPLISDGIIPAPLKSEVNGFNQQLLLTDGRGFSQGQILISWLNTGNDDTQATKGQPYEVAMSITLYQHYMEHPNRPSTMAEDGYYYTPQQVAAIGDLWRALFAALPEKLPAWFNADTQDDIARSKGWAVSSVVDTGFIEDIDARMWVWWWNHAMGDAPGIDYARWAPPVHYAVRWLPGFSPAEVLGDTRVPIDRVVPGIIYPDIQKFNLHQTGGGMMSYPPDRSPIPGKYTTLNPMFVVSRQHVSNFHEARFPEPDWWLLHQWGDVDGGVVHRSTVLAKLPLPAPITQQGYYAEHQLHEAQFWGNYGMRKAYKKWLAVQKREGEIPQ